MFIKNKYFWIAFVIVSISFNNELLFNEDGLFDNYAISLGATSMFGCNECDVDDDRKIGNLNRLNMSLFIKANHRINIYYYPKGGDYSGFNLPNTKESDYYGLGSQHFIKNKTSMNLDFDIFTNLMFAGQDFYEKYAMGFGISKMLDPKDFQSYIRINFTLYSYKSNDIDLGDGEGWSFGFDYPIYMRVLPKDNIPSKISYVLTPQVIIDIPSVNTSNSNNMYFNCSFDISYAF